MQSTRSASTMTLRISPSPEVVDDIEPFASCQEPLFVGAPGGIRTPDPQIRRKMVRSRGRIRTADQGLMSPHGQRGFCAFCAVVSRFARSQNRRSTTKRTHRRSAPHGGQMQAARRNLSGGIRKTSSLGSDEAVGRNGTRMRGYLVRHRPRWSIVSATSRKLSLYRNRKRPRAARRRSLAATVPDSPKRRTRCCPRRRPCSRRSQC